MSVLSIRFTKWQDKVKPSRPEGPWRLVLLKIDSLWTRNDYALVLATPLSSTVNDCRCIWPVHVSRFGDSRYPRLHVQLKLPSRLLHWPCSQMPASSSHSSTSDVSTQHTQCLSVSTTPSQKAAIRDYDVIYRYIMYLYIACDSVEDGAKTIRTM